MNGTDCRFAQGPFAERVHESGGSVHHHRAGSWTSKENVS